MKGVVVSRSLRVAGDELDEDIIQYVRNKYNLLIGQRMAEQAKISIGSAYHLPQEKTITLRGRNLITGLPEAIEVSSVELREATAGSVQTIVNVVKDALDEAPPEIIADLMDIGICLAGGGSLLQGLAEAQGLTAETKVVAHEDVFEAIMEEAQRHNVVMVNAPSEGLLEQRLFGSIPERLARECPKTVSMVKRYQPVRSRLARWLGIGARKPNNRNQT